MKHLREALRLAPDDEEAQRTFKRARKVCAHVCTCGHSLRAACHSLPSRVRWAAASDALGFVFVGCIACRIGPLCVALDVSCRVSR